MIKHYNIKITSDYNKVILLNRYILSAFNLSFLHFLTINQIFLHKNLICWPDGISVKFFSSINKIPGRYLISNLQIPKKIKKMIILGNATKLDKKFMKKKYKNLVISHKNLPYLDIKKIKNNLDLKIKKNNIYLITLPTPKQEQLALYLSSKNKDFKCICIGGGLAMASGQDSKVPYILDLFNLEFIWRLRSDFKRRITRLIYSILSLLKFILTNKKINFVKIYE